VNNVFRLLKGGLKPRPTFKASLGRKNQHVKSPLYQPSSAEALASTQFFDIKTHDLQVRITPSPAGEGLGGGE